MRRNQRYFTFGQGGYFSPDSYVLLNSPFSWEGHPMNHVAYKINGSIGVQSFYEATAYPGSTIATDTTPTLSRTLAPTTAWMPMWPTVLTSTGI